MNNIINSSPFLTPSVLYQSNILRQNLDSLVKEQISGKSSDVTSHLKGDYTALTAMDNEITRLRGYSIMTTEASIWSEMMGSALEVFNSDADSLISRLTISSSIETRQQLDAITADASSIFQNMISTLNTRSSDRALFSGDGGSVSPLPVADVLLDHLSVALVGVSTSSDAIVKIEEWFTSPTGFLSLYVGGAPRADYSISRGENVNLGITAIDSGLRGTLAGVATLALLDRGFLSGSTTEQFELVKDVTRSLAATSEPRSQLSSRLGVAQERIEKAQARNATLSSALQIARTELLEIDPYETTIKLKDLEAKLEAFYTILSRLSNLSLINFIR